MPQHPANSNLKLNVQHQKTDPRGFLGGVEGCLSVRVTGCWFVLFLFFFFSFRDPDKLATLRQTGQIKYKYIWEVVETGFAGTTCQTCFLSVVISQSAVSAAVILAELFLLSLKRRRELG